MSTEPAVALRRYFAGVVAGHRGVACDDGAKRCDHPSHRAPTTYPCPPVQIRNDVYDLLRAGSMRDERPARPESDIAADALVAAAENMPPEVMLRADGEACFAGPSGWLHAAAARVRRGEPL